MKIINVIIAILFMMASCNTPKSNQDITTPSNLRCEVVINPVGIDVVNPRLSWMLTSKQNNEVQTAYHIIVSSTLELLANNEGDLWNSDKINSDKSIHVTYAGLALQTGQKCFWKVKVWDRESNQSDWSEPAFWSMGIMNKLDWKAKWIGYEKALGNDKPNDDITVLSARYLRKEVNLEKEVASATAYISGLGISELYINGGKIGDHVLSPGQTQFDKRSLYVTHDITKNIVSGKNAIGVILGNGRFFTMRYKIPFPMETFGLPKLLIQIDIKYTDGSTSQIISDESWKLTADGPITENSEFDGEKYDARKEMPGWSSAGFDDSKWLDVELVETPSEAMSAQVNEPIRITEEINPIKITEINPGVFIYDMGQNMVGWVSLKVNGKNGDAVKLRFAEATKDDGSLYLDNIRSAEVTDIYTCKGEGEVVWEPRFTYHGFRYVELTGYPDTPTLETIIGKIIHDDVDPIGTFECSADMVNNIYRNSTWGIRGNYRSWPTDCPQRDERQAWLGDRATGSRGESYIYDISKLYAKWLRDIGDAQNEVGSIPDVCPAYWKMYHDNITWNGTPIILANMLYEQYGDDMVIKESYVYMKKWYDYMTNKYLADGIMPRDSYGDWCMPPEDLNLIHSVDPKRATSGAFLGTTFFYYMTNIMSDFAIQLGKSDDAEHFNSQATIIKEAVNRDFFDKEFATYVNNTATASLLALSFGLVPDEYEDKIFTNILEKIEIQHDKHIPVGLIGAQFLMRTLTEHGKGDIALRFATQTDYPSWGYMVEQGATTIWELWNGNTADPAMNSRNHVMLLGDFNIWLYEDLAGIKPNKPAFKEITMKPHIIKGLDFVKASHNSPYGKISSSWKVSGNKFNWDITIPVNTSAIIYVPCDGDNSVKINGQKENSNAKFIEYSNGRAEFKIGSGVYSITSTGFEVIGENPDMVNSPTIVTAQSVSTNSISVNISCDTKDAEIRYTTNGFEPDEKSTLYNGELLIEETSVLVAKAFKEGVKPSFIQTKSLVIYNEIDNGLNYKYYEGKWDFIPDFSKLTPKFSGKTLDISDLKQMALRENFWGIQFTGKIDIPTDGEYMFALSSDDGSSLYIDGKQIIINDGIHSPIEIQGNVNLTKGKHDIRIDFFEGNYGERLVFSYSGDGIPRQVVPASMLYFE